MTKGLPRGVYYRGEKCWIVYRNEHGNRVRESTRQVDPEVAEQIRAKRLTQVALGRHFSARRFERVSFDEVARDWWGKPRATYS